MSAGYDPFKWADMEFEDVADYQKNFKEDVKKILEEMKRCSRQKNEKSTSEEVTSQE